MLDASAASIDIRSKIGMGLESLLTSTYCEFRIGLLKDFIEPHGIRNMRC
jgi:hypothetical protein